MPVLDVSSEKLLQKLRGTTVLHPVFHTLAYSDVFDFPLTAKEVWRYLTSTKASFEDVNRALADTSLFEQTGEYFTLRGRGAIVEIRKHRAGIAARLWPRAWRYGRIIASLPFVRMVAVTGSLSMSNTDESNDVDYMIVTAPGRLWTVRALSLLIARMAKLEGVNLCPNYLVTTHALELNERSLYVAHELAQTIPISGMEIYHEIRRRNRWLEDYLPNASGAPESPEGLKPASDSSLLQKAFELLLPIPFVKWFEKWEMDRKMTRLTREQSASLESYFSPDVCKGHIDQHGENVVTALAVRLEKTTTPAQADGATIIPEAEPSGREVATTGMT